ncbi:DUF4313 domain-containing protein [Hespellia stercorisuis]|uniref:DUF4313 domain-containing protein n=1 Tax=Hespellia stercorisuis DSM 15480 TaxID=1121950 RepID=A0A1M6WBD5_9FIRM|nr:DUF4313 domain-containing protein [Hespellia stercorisuis]SHK90948.1 protein of unknown function [Hespellia stercorisuis DSM 15480]
MSAYTNNDRLYVGLVLQEERVQEFYGSLTINLPDEPAEKNEAYIDALASEDKLKFIRTHKLGKVLPDKGYSGYGVYAKVAFDLQRLRELDPQGMKEFEKLHGIEEESQQVKKKKARSDDAR